MNDEELSSRELRQAADATKRVLSKLDVDSLPRASVDRLVNRWASLHAKACQARVKEIQEDLKQRGYY